MKLILILIKIQHKKSILVSFCFPLQRFLVNRASFGEFSPSDIRMWLPEAGYFRMVKLIAWGLGTYLKRFQDGYRNNMGRGRGRLKKSKVTLPSILTTLLQQSIMKDDSERGSTMGTESNLVKSCDEKKETLGVKSSEFPYVANKDFEAQETTKEAYPKLWVWLLVETKCHRMDQ